MKYIIIVLVIIFSVERKDFMNSYFFVLMISAMIFFACARQDPNPFFSEYNTPFKAPPFNLISEEHYLPAYHEGIKQKELEIAAIS